MKKTLSLLVIPLLLAACTDQTRSSLGGTVDVGSLPADVCFIAGRPQILSVSVENEGDIDLAYLSKDGLLVNQKYGTGAFGVTTSEQGRLTWKLPAKQVCQ